MKGIKFYHFVILLLIVGVNLVTQFLIIPRFSPMIGVLGSTLLLFFLCLIGFEWIYRKIMREAENIHDFLEPFSRGDFLTAKEKHAEVKEFVPIHERLIQIRERMKEWLHNIIYSEVHLSDFAKELSHNSDISLRQSKEISNDIAEIVKGSEKAARDSAENAAIAEELMGSNTEAASYSEEAKNFALESVASIERDATDLKNCLQEIEDVVQMMSNLSHYVENFKKSLDAILGMADGISNIAQQTNLLSLNASIEAARAGEHGRGFGVVAQEIKKLAEQSGAIVSEINKDILEIQENTEDTVQVMNQTVQKSKEIREKSVQASDNLFRIVENIKKLLDLISNISNNITEQANASEALAKNIEAIANFTHETDLTTKKIDQKITEQSKSIQRNANISEKITEIAEKFNAFIEPIEKEMNVALLEACDQLAKTLHRVNLSNEFLDQWSKNTGISEIYIADGRGVITHSNNRQTIGFQFSSVPGSQTYDFYRILQDRSLRVCQRMRKRDIDGKYFKIVGISRTDAAGIVQVGLSLEDIVNFKGKYKFDVA